MTPDFEVSVQPTLEHQVLKTSIAAGSIGLRSRSSNPTFHKFDAGIDFHA